MTQLLVIGREGQLARSLLAADRASGITVSAAGRPALDLTVSSTVAATMDRMTPDLVVNAAAYTSVDKAEEEAERAFAINASGAAHLARECAERDIPLIHISTDYVYDGAKAGYYREDDPTSPLGVYGRSKLEGEEKVAALCPKHVILRTAWVFSPYGSNFVKTMLRLAGTRSELCVVNDQRGSPTYAPHLADAILTIAERITAVEQPDALWGVYHAAGTGEASWCELANEVFRRSEERGGPAAHAHPITTEEYPTAAARPANSRLNCSKLKQTFDVELPIWTDGVLTCLDQLLSDKRIR